MNILGVQGFTVRDYMGDKKQLEETFKKIADIGYNGIQTDIPSYIDIHELKEMLSGYGLRSLTVDGSAYDIIDKPEPIITAAHILGIDLVFVESIPVEMRNSEDDYHRFAADLNRAGKIAAAEGLRISYHPHSVEFCSFGGYNGMDILINETDDCVEFMPDTHWQASAGVNPPDFIRRLVGRCSQIHFKDYAIELGAKKLETVLRQYAEVGQGNLNWPDIIRACRETGIRIFVVEQDICKVDPFTSLAISFKAMKLLGL